MIHIYTGNGKGKTTCAIGLAIRARGHGLKVAIFQFLKPRSVCSGEEKILDHIKGIDLIKFRQVHPMFKKGVSIDKLRRCVEKDFKKIENVALSNRYDMIVLDEIVNCVDQGLICKDSLIKLLRTIPGNLELVLTGRGDISLIRKCADYITIMKESKHPFKKGKQARKGIEY